MRTRQIPEKEIQVIALAAVEIGLAQRETKDESPITASAVPFVQQLIINSRELFKTLAYRQTFSDEHDQERTIKSHLFMDGAKDTAFAAALYF